MTTYKSASVRGRKHFYREAGPAAAPTIVLLHGFPSSSHMYRDLIPMLADKFHVIAPDYVGFGYSDMPLVNEFEYTFDNLAAHIEELLFSNLGLKKFSIYVQDYGAPIGYRIASKHPGAIEGIIVQNGNAYAEGIGPGFDAIKPLWKNRNAETEAAARALLKLETTKFQYVNGVKDESKISPDAYHVDQMFLDRPGNDAIQVNLLHNYQANLPLYDGWQAYFRKYQPRMLITWGINDVFFPVPGAKAYLRDLPKAELHLIETGHFALEDNGAFIAERIRKFFA
ncbi:MAG: alpha/beta fold hydrolase [Tepidisphaeraceae bacterium]|jgi:pimeloyl-ACP methyl ester carboxylesterase